MLSGRPLIKTYIVSEILLFIPNFLFALMIAMAGLSAAHGFSPGELPIPLLIMLISSIIPVGLSFRILQKKALNL